MLPRVSLMLLVLASAVFAAAPQTPVPPFPYAVEEVSFVNPDNGLHLAGTLTLPATGTPCPCVVLISGAGPQDRDESFFEHRPFLVLADAMTRRGVGVLRYDDPGMGKSEGTITAQPAPEAASDVRAAVAYLRSRPECGSVGLIGHSEGGMVAFMVAAGSPEIAFVVSLAAPCLPGEELAMQQALAMVAGMPLDPTMLSNLKTSFRNAMAAMKAEPDTAAVEPKVRAALAGMPPMFLEVAVSRLVNPWAHFIVCHDPADDLARIKCPVLGVFGDKDQLIVARDNRAAMQAALARAGNTHVKTVIMPGHNHMFQTGEDKDFLTLEETFSPLALHTIGTWIVNDRAR